MAALGRLIMDTAKLAVSALNIPNDPKPPPVFESPSIGEVLEVKYMLFMTFDLPIEIIDVIIDYGEYWPHSSVSTSGRVIAVGGYGNARQDTFVMRTLPLGYGISDTDNGLPLIPLDTYVTMNNLAHVIDSSDALKAMTSDLLNQWKSQSKPRGDHPCRKVVFTIKSKDQGWVSQTQFRDTYRGSYTWFDVGLEKFLAVDKELCTPEVQIPNGFKEQLHLKQGNGRDIPSISCDLQIIHPAVKEGGPTGHIYDHPSEPGGTRLQANRTGSKEVGEYTITWAYDDCIDPLSAEADRLEQEGRGRCTANGEFVRNLQVGDIITIWARARFPGWTNELKEMKIDVYWAI